MIGKSEMPRTANEKSKKKWLNAMEVNVSSENQAAAADDIFAVVKTRGSK